jgi:DNA-directed RNA polymerase specialized sigma subunit, sigma54 homolog
VPATVKECLEIQLRNRDELTDNLKTLIEDHLEDLAGNRLSAIAKEMGVTVQDVQRMADVVRDLEPKPGRQFASEMTTKYIVPDVIVEEADGEYVVSINESSVPKLSVSSYYKDLLHKADTDKQLAEYLARQSQFCDMAHQEYRTEKADDIQRGHRGGQIPEGLFRFTEANTSRR